MKFRYSFITLIIFLIFIRFYFEHPVYKNGDFIRITSRLYTEPIIFDRQQYFKIQGLKIYLTKYPEVNYGDRIILEGVVKNDSLQDAKLLKIVEDSGWIYNFRQEIIFFYKKVLPEPYSSLVSGMVLGSKQMPKDFWQKLKSTGTAHVVVASGTNVTLVAVFLISSLTYFFKRRVAVFISLAGIFFYVILSGFDAPIVRAAIMGSIVFFGQEKGRVVDSWNILFYTAMIMLLIKPIWITDLGFILSFVATLSILLYQKRIDDSLKFVPKLLREGLSTSLSAQIGVAPIIFITFGQFNLLSPIINALVLWTTPYIMVGGVMAGIIGLFIPLVGRLILFVIFPMLWWFVNLIQFFG